MVEISFEEAREFLGGINKNDKVAVIHHDDLDGFSSGIIFYDWCKARGTEVKNFIYTNETSSLDNLDLKDFNKIILTDLPPGVLKGLENLNEKEVFYTDHHPKDVEVPEFIFEFRTTKEGYIPSSRTAAELTGIKKWLGIIGTVGDAGDLYEENKDFIEKFLNESDMDMGELNHVMYILTDTIVYFNDSKQEAFDKIKDLKSIEEVLSLKKYYDIIEGEIEKVVEEFEMKKEKIGESIYFYFESPYYIKKPFSAIISKKYQNEILIFATPIDEGTISISARNQSKKNDMAHLLNEAIKNIPNARAGGHFAASGASVSKDYLEKFKENLKIVRV